MADMWHQDDGGVVMDNERVRDVLNALVYDIEFVESLSRVMAARCAEVIRTPDGYLSLYSPDEFVSAIDVALAEGILPSLDTYRCRFTDDEIVAFFRLVQTALRESPSGKGPGIRSRLSAE